MLLRMFRHTFNLIILTQATIDLVVNEVFEGSQLCKILQLDKTTQIYIYLGTTYAIKTQKYKVTLLQQMCRGWFYGFAGNGLA